MSNNRFYGGAGISPAAQQLSAGMQKVAADNANLRQLVGELRAKLASYEHRDQIEHLMLRARDEGGGQLSRVAPMSVDDFLAKRAHLMQQGPEMLNKIAAALDLMGDDGFTGGFGMGMEPARPGYSQHHAESDLESFISSADFGGYDY